MSGSTTDPNAPLGGTGQTDPTLPPSAQPDQSGPSPDFWRTLASFGGNMAVAANARGPGGFLKYGPGFAGPLGAGVIGALETQRQNAITASALGLQKANTADVQGQVQTRNLQNQRSQMQMAMLPQLMQSPFGGSGGGNGGQAPATPSQAPTPGTSGGGFDALANAPAALKPMIMQSAQKHGLPAPLLAGLLQQENGMNVATGNLGSILPKTAAAPGYGVAPITPQQVADPASNIDFTANYLSARGADAGVKNWNDPSQAAVGLRAYNGGGDPQYVPHVARFAPSIFGGAQGATAQAGAPPAGTGAAAPSGGGGATPGAAPAPFAGMPTMQEALQRADQLTQRAMQFRLAGLDPTAIETQAQQYRAMAQNLYEAQAKPQNYRAGGLGVNPLTNQTTQVPTVQSGQNQAGAPTKFFAAPAPIVNGQTQGANYVSPPISTGQAPADADNNKNFAELSGKAYLAAQGTLGWATDMEHSFKNLNSGGGWSSTGAAANARMEIAKAINSASGMVGGAPVFDPSKVADWESLTHETARAGMQLVNQNFGASREAASIIQSAQSSVPSANSTPQGAQLVLNGIREGAQNIIDRHNFTVQWQQQHGNVTGAEEAFDQMASPQMYTRRAISTIQPPTLAGPDEFGQYLPGTYFQAKGDPSGALRQVPMRDGMPGLPDWMNHQTQAAAQPQPSQSAPTSTASADPTLGNQ